MSIIGGANIVTDGLISYYDPGNKLSYPGSGTLLKDLTGNHHATITGSPPFNQTGYTGTNLILRNKSDYGGQAAGMPDGSFDIPSFFVGIYFRDTALLSSSGGTFNAGTDTLYILNPDGSLFFSIDTTQTTLFSGISTFGVAIKYTLSGTDLDGFAADNNTAAGQTFNSALAAASTFADKKTAWETFITPHLVASGGNPFNSTPFKVATELPVISSIGNTFKFEDNDSITLGNLPQTQQYTYEFAFKPVDYTDASNNNYQKMLVNSANSFFIILEENRIFRHRVPGVDAGGNVGGNTVYETDRYSIATFSYDQSVSKNYKNGVLTNSKSVGSGTVDAGTLSLFTSSGPVQQYVGHFAFFRAYDRALTDAEVKQNFEATKIRFGL